MKILGIIGSPKKKKSSSEYLLNGFVNYLNKETQVDILPLKEIIKMDNLSEYSTIVISFPLYVDGIPSHLLVWMKEMEEKLVALEAAPLLYCIVNSGFFESIQSKLSIDLIKNWCCACSMPFFGAVACGGGGMVRVAPIGHGTGKKFGIALNRLAKSVQSKEPIETQFVEPNFPRFLYIQAAHFAWRKKGKANGLTKKDLYAKR